MSKLRLVLSSAALSGLLVIAWAGAASAHIDPDPATIPAGKQATVAFKVEHGCEGEATTEVEFKVPDSVTDAAPVEKEGWTGSTDGQVVTFSGGSQPGDEETTFSLTFTAPDTEGTDLVFPVIQSCGSDTLEWIQTSESDEHPAPVVMVGAAGSAPVTAGEHADEGEGDGHSAETTSEHSTTSAAEDDDDSSTPELIAAGVVVVVLIIGIGLALTRGRKTEA